MANGAPVHSRSQLTLPSAGTFGSSVSTAGGIGCSGSAGTSQLLWQGGQRARRSRPGTIPCRARAGQRAGHSSHDQGQDGFFLECRRGARGKKERAHFAFDFVIPASPSTAGISPTTETQSSSRSTVLCAICGTLGRTSSAAGVERTSQLALPTAYPLIDCIHT